MFTKWIPTRGDPQRNHVKAAETCLVFDDPTRKSLYVLNDMLLRSFQ